MAILSATRLKTRDYDGGIGEFGTMEVDCIIDYNVVSRTPESDGWKEKEQ
jgi:hypothetical protein